MSKLSNIPEIEKSSLELLEAAGFSDAEALAKAGVDELARELERANTILQIAKRAPARGSVEKWIASARDLVGDSTDRNVRMPVNYEQSPEVASMLESSPFAIPLPARLLMEQRLAVADIPAAILLNRYSGDLEVKVDERAPDPKPGRPVPVASTNVRIAESHGTRLEIDTSRIKPIEALAGASSRPTTSRSAERVDRVALIRGPRLETNKGRDPQSRAFIRGVLHSHPVLLGAGAAVTLLLGILLPVAILSATLLLISREVPKHFGWVPEWFLVFPLSLPLVGLAYLIWGIRGNCRICGQRLFVPRMCLKNNKAHHIRGLGYIAPVALHMLLFKWFRCTYCGTPVRLKK